ncbi:hypothetical protein H257_03938 [Aphanomyces astaci]|uniref:Uncharacterized protein n=1 Tax=Aphanomyces astaci TaxID=112090 RepID=W4GZW3_APHAT|nr:hypothetical protein H257_03938 [Aphanomyces astaci]ETV84871.1 hypothetical protein H257_03938 [Aphanomyces astaci]|eukprot:XP_009826563.1 hypothetical protein H257_03938 [Aphanomyces astaci]
MQLSTPPCTWRRCYETSTWTRLTRVGRIPSRSPSATNFVRAELGKGWLQQMWGISARSVATEVGSWQAYSLTSFDLQWQNYYLTKFTTRRRCRIRLERSTPSRSSEATHCCDCRKRAHLQCTGHERATCGVWSPTRRRLVTVR